jgi:hypothetical protein
MRAYVHVCVRVSCDNSVTLYKMVVLPSCHMMATSGVKMQVIFIACVRLHGVSKLVV